MKTIYSIEHSTKPKNVFDLENYGDQTAAYIIGSRSGTSKTLYRDVTEDDYDNGFAHRIIETKPAYEVDKFLDYHFDFYVNNGGSEATFIKHMKYVIIPILKKRENSGVQIELISTWLNDKARK